MSPTLKGELIRKWICISKVAITLAQTDKKKPNKQNKNKQTFQAQNN